MHHALTILALVSVCGCGSWTNWSGTIHCQPRRVERPRSERELRAMVAAGSHVRVVGAGHSFNALACSNDVMLDLRELNHVLEIDAARGLVKVEAGITLHDLDEELAKRGLALGTEPTIDKITAAGAISTASHGTGFGHGAFSEEVTALDVIDAAGNKVIIDGGERLAAARIGLGALGVIYAITFRVERAFNFEIDERVVGEDEAFAQLDRLPLENEHADLFWLVTEHKVFLRTYKRTTAPVHLEHPAADWLLEHVVRTWVAHFGLAVASKIPGVTPLLNKAEPSTFRRRVEVDRSDRILHRFPGHQRVVSMEYVIPVEHTRAALRAIADSLTATGFYPNVPPYVRFVGGGGDGLLSPMRGRKSCAVEVLSYPGFAGWERFFRDLEPRFRALGGRPHWGKLFYENPHSLYEPAAWKGFASLHREIDPRGKFDNALMRWLLH
ncbi:MAG: oxidoreductase [Myxococcales bacterium]|nr:oxidoreductase [Myxococcales bacterium]